MAGSTSAVISSSPSSLVARCALVDPPANHRRLGGCGRTLPAWRHCVLVRWGQPDAARSISLSAARPATITASVLTTLADALECVEPELALGSVRAVAVDAAPGEDWLHERRIGDRPIGAARPRCRGGAAGYSPEPSADRGGGVLREIALAVRQRRAEVTRNGDDDDRRDEQCAVHRSLPVPAGGSGAQQSSHTTSARRQWPPRPQAARATRTSARRSCRCRRAGNQRPRQPAPRWRRA